MPSARGDTRNRPATGTRGSTSGSEPTDFAGFPSGHIALIQRGTCGFRDKVDSAVAAGAAGVIVFNQGDVVPGDDRMGLFGGTLNAPQAKIPVVSTTFDNEAELAAQRAATLHLAVDATVTGIKSFNILADTDGRSDRKVVVGAHLDSVAEGPGINDNGTGVGTVLETAIQLKKTRVKVANKVRFAFWGGEEDGLIGSDYYVSRLSRRRGRLLPRGLRHRRQRQHHRVGPDGRRSSACHSHPRQ